MMQLSRTIALQDSDLGSGIRGTSRERAEQVAQRQEVREYFEAMERGLRGLPGGVDGEEVGRQGNERRGGLVGPDGRRLPTLAEIEEMERVLAAARNLGL